MGAKLSLQDMKRWIVAILYLWPGVTLVAIGSANIVSGYTPWLAAKIGHAPTWLSVGAIVFGALSAIPGLIVLYLQQRLRTLAAMRRADA
jgi:hypothetical protein